MSFPLSKLASQLQVDEPLLKNVIKLLFEEQCTIPFVARYRKEATGSMDEVVLRNIRDAYTYNKELEETKARYLKVVEEHLKSKPELYKNWPEVQKAFLVCETKQALEDLYLPYKPKRRTRAQIAREKGLGPLVEQILASLSELSDLNSLAQTYVSEEKGLATIEDVLQGVSDILSETISETAEIRKLTREISTETGLISSTKIEKAEENTDKREELEKYKNYFDYREPITKAASHRIMAIRRGEAEKFLRVRIEVDAEQIQHEIMQAFLAGRMAHENLLKFLRDCIKDAYQRLLFPSIETEIRLELKKKAEEDAIKVFSKNLSKLIMLPPIPHTTVLGVDPGIRTGSKLAVVDQTGKLLEWSIVMPMFGSLSAPKTIKAIETVAELIKKHNVNYIALGNGTGSREIGQLINQALKDHNLKHVKKMVVNESGASIYSTDDIAREEFPDLDPTIRSAISIARRLQDPLAELVKIDPRSIGVGQYQHDLNVVRLSDSLKDTVESCVNQVGVDVNTASYKLLGYVSGINQSVAKSIVHYREQHGPFTQRTDLQKVTGFGAKTFEQAAGFLRVPGGVDPLDNSSVHPERYPVVKAIAQDMGVDLKELVGDEDKVKAISVEKYVDDQTGMPTLLDILEELKKPGRDPRVSGTSLTFSDKVAEITDLSIGMKMKGTVSNVTNFGAFVDLGVHQDGLIHISELSDQFVSDPATVISVGDVVEVTVIDLDVKRRRISLSLKKQPQLATDRPQQRERENTPVRHENRPNNQSAPRRTFNNNGPRNNYSNNHSRDGRQAAENQQQQGRRPAQQHERRPPKPSERNFSVGDLLSKFNVRS